MHNQGCLRAGVHSAKKTQKYFDKKFCLELCFTNSEMEGALLLVLLMSLF